MLADLLFQCIEFAIQTVILFGLLWLMIKIQKLDQRFEFSFLGVLGAAALATFLNLALRIILEHFIGLYLAAYIAGPIVFIVLLHRVKKVTGADYVDALFTVAIARALLFAINLIVLASLLDNLQARVENPGEFEAPAPAARIAPRAVNPTNAPAPLTNPPVATVPPGPVKPVPAQPVVETAAVKTNLPAQSPPTNLVAPPAPAKPAQNLARYFSVKGVTRNGAHSSATIRSGTKVYTVFLGEAALMQTIDGPFSVRFSDFSEDMVTLEINGEQAKYPIPRP